MSAARLDNIDTIKLFQLLIFGKIIFQIYCSTTLVQAYSSEGYCCY
jgi:hypothetical protein